MRYDAATGDFIDSFASGGGLDNATGLVFIPEPTAERFSAQGWPHSPRWGTAGDRGHQ